MTSLSMNFHPQIVPSSGYIGRIQVKLENEIIKVSQVVISEIKNCYLYSTCINFYEHICADSCTYVCIYAYVCLMYICVFVHMCVCVYMHLCVYVCVFVCVRVCVCVYV